MPHHPPGQGNRLPFVDHENRHFSARDRAMRNFFATAVAIITGAVLVAGAFVISVVFFAIILAIGLVLGGYLFWKTRHLRKQMRQQNGERDVIEGTVISSEEIHTPEIRKPEAPP
jgi:predicted membrane protein